MCSIRSWHLPKSSLIALCSSVVECGALVIKGSIAVLQSAGVGAVPTRSTSNQWMCCREGGSAPDCKSGTLRNAVGSNPITSTSNIQMCANGKRLALGARKCRFKSYHLYQCTQIKIPRLILSLARRWNSGKAISLCTYQEWLARTVTRNGFDGDGESSVCRPSGEPKSKDAEQTSIELVQF